MPLNEFLVTRKVPSQSDIRFGDTVFLIGKIIALTLFHGLQRNENTKIYPKKIYKCALHAKMKRAGLHTRTDFDIDNGL